MHILKVIVIVLVVLGIVLGGLWLNSLNIVISANFSDGSVLQAPLLTSLLFLFLTLVVAFFIVMIVVVVMRFPKRWNHARQQKIVKKLSQGWQNALTDIYTGNLTRALLWVRRLKKDSTARQGAKGQGAKGQRVVSNIISKVTSVDGVGSRLLLTDLFARYGDFHSAHFYAQLIDNHQHSRIAQAIISWQHMRHGSFFSLKSEHVDSMMVLLAHRYPDPELYKALYHWAKKAEHPYQVLSTLINNDQKLLHHHVDNTLESIGRYEARLIMLALSDTKANISQSKTIGLAERARLLAPEDFYVGQAWVDIHVAHLGIEKTVKKMIRLGGDTLPMSMIVAYLIHRYRDEKKLDGYASAPQEVQKIVATMEESNEYKHCVVAIGYMLAGMWRQAELELTTKRLHTSAQKETSSAQASGVVRTTLLAMLKRHNGDIRDAWNYFDYSAPHFIGLVAQWNLDDSSDFIAFINTLSDVLPEVRAKPQGPTTDALPLGLRQSV